MNEAGYELLVLGHAAFGTVALAAFWWQILGRKHGRRHRRVGQVFFLAMAGVVATAVPMAAYLARGSHWASALFLAFLAWITVAAGVGAWMASRWRDTRMAGQRRFGTLASGLLLVVCLAMLALFRVGGALFVGLGALGAWAAITDLRRPADDPVWTDWRIRHVEGVMGTGIAVHVAFLAFGLRGLLGADYGNLHFLLAFTVPVLLGVWASHHFTRRYRPPGPGRSATSADP